MKLIFVLLLCPLTLFSQKKIDQAKFKTLMNLENVQIIDVRTPEEFADGHIQNAVNIDYFSKSFSVNISKLNKQKTVLVYCAAGGRSATAAKELKKLGFKKVYDLTGGYDDWKE